MVWMSSGVLARDLLDVHAAARRGDERDRLGAAIDQHRQIQFLGDVVRFGDQHQVHRQRAAAGLVGLHAACRACRPRRPSTSSSVLQNFTPPALPRPPAWICALTIHCSPPSARGGFDRVLRRVARPCRPAPRCRTRRTVAWPGIRGNSCRAPCVNGKRWRPQFDARAVMDDRRSGRTRGRDGAYCRATCRRQKSRNTAAQRTRVQSQRRMRKPSAMPASLARSRHGRTSRTVTGQSAELPQSPRDTHQLIRQPRAAIRGDIRHELYFFNLTACCRRSSTSRWPSARSPSTGCRLTHAGWRSWSRAVYLIVRAAGADRARDSMRATLDGSVSAGLVVDIIAASLAIVADAGGAHRHRRSCCWSTSAPARCCCRRGCLASSRRWPRSA